MIFERSVVVDEVFYRESSYFYSFLLLFSRILYYFLQRFTGTSMVLKYIRILIIVFVFTGIYYNTRAVPIKK